MAEKKKKAAGVLAAVQSAAAAIKKTSDDVKKAAQNGGMSGAKKVSSSSGVQKNSVKKSSGKNSTAKKGGGLKTAAPTASTGSGYERKYTPEYFVRNESPIGKGYDRKFTPSYFENNSRYTDLYKKNDADMTAGDIAETIDMFRRIQAGENYRTKQGAGRYSAGESQYAMNDAVNQNRSQQQWNAYLSKASEQDISDTIKTWEKYLKEASVDAGSDYAKRTQEDLDTLKNYARKNYSAYNEGEMVDYSTRIAQNNRRLKELGAFGQGDRAEVGAAQSALDAMGTGNDPISMVERDEVLRRVTGYDSLLKKYGDNEMALSDAIRESLSSYMAGAYPNDEEQAEIERLRKENSTLNEQMQESAKQRDKLERRDYLKGLSGDAAGFDVEPYNAYEETEVYDERGNKTGDVRYNAPELEQIIADPEAVYREYQKYQAATGASGYAETIGLARHMTEDEREAYKGIYAHYGADIANEWFENLKPTLEARETQMLAEDAQGLAKEHPIISGALSIATNELAKRQRQADMIRTIFGGEPSERQQEALTEALRGTALNELAENTNWATFEIDGHEYNPFNMLAQGALSTGDEKLATVITGPWHLLDMGLDAMASAYLDSYGKYGDREAALLSGLGSGISEYGSEYVGDLIPGVDMGGSGLKRLAGWGLNAAGEGLEEVASSVGSEIGNEISYLLTGHGGDMQDSYNYLTANGYSGKEALGILAKQFGLNAIDEFAVGAIAGGMMGAGSAVNSAVQERAANTQAGQEIAQGGSVAAVLEAGLKSKDRSTRKIAQGLVDKLNLTDSSKPVLSEDAKTQAELQYVQEAVNAEQKAASTEQQAVNAEQKKADDAKQQANNEKRTEEKMLEPTRELTKKEARQVGKVYRQVLRALDVQVTRDNKKLSKELKKRLSDYGEEQLQEVTDAIADVALLGEDAPAEAVTIAEAAAAKDGVIKEIFTGLKQDVGKIIAFNRSALGNGAQAAGMAAESEQATEQAEVAEQPIRTAQKGSVRYTTEDGGTVQGNIEGFAISEDGSMAAVIDGQSVPADRLETGDDGMDTLISRAVELGQSEDSLSDEDKAELANIMYKGYEAGQDVDSYTRSFEAAYHYGEAGMNRESVQKRPSVKALSEAQFEEAYDTGAAVADTRGHVTASRSGGEVRFADGLKDKIRTLGSGQRAAVNAITKLATELKAVNIEFFESQADKGGSYMTYENGSYDPSTNTLRIDINAGRNSESDVAEYAMLRTASHELTHYIKSQNASAYGELMDYVAANLTDGGENAFDALVEAKMESQSLKYTDAVEEVVADGCEMMLKDSTAVEQLAKQNKSLFKRVQRWIKNFAQSVKRAFEGVSARSLEARLLEKAEGLQKLWDNALVGAVENVRKGGTEGSGSKEAAGENGAVKQSPRRKAQLTDREILASAFESVVQNENEGEYLEKYKAQIGSLNEKEAQRKRVQEAIREKMLSEGVRNGSYRTELNRLRSEEKRLANEIDRMDRKLLNLERAKPLKDVLAREQQKAKEKAMKLLHEGQARNRERREATEYRQRIRRVADSFDRKLKNPTQKNYIPQAMVGMSIKMREMVDTRSGREGEKAKAKIAEIKQMYNAYKEDLLFGYVHDDILDSMLTSLEKTVGEKTIYQLNRDQLKSVYEVMSAIQKQVTDAAKLKSMYVNVDGKEATIFDVGKELYRETAQAEPMLKGALSDYLNWQLTPDKFFARIGGYTKGGMWETVGRSFSRGTEKMLEVKRAASNNFGRYTNSSQFDKLGSTKESDMVDIGLRDEKGDVIKVTRGMMLEAYMHLSSADNANGFMYGGFSVPNLKKYYANKVTESYGTGSINTIGTAMELADIDAQLQNLELTEAERESLMEKKREAETKGIDRMTEMRENIEEKLTDWEKGLIEAVHKWNDGASRDYINEVTLDLYGLRRAGVENYYPIHRDPAFVNRDFESISKNMNLENWGALKDRVPSRAPILLGDIAYTLANSIDQMGRYVGYARVQHDFNKLYNVRMPGMAGSVKKAVGTKFGTGKRIIGASGEQYIENFIGSITGSRGSEGDWTQAIRRNLPRATMSFNYRVGFSQLSAIPKAAQEVGWDCLLEGLKNGGIRAIVSSDARRKLAQKNAYFWDRYNGEGGEREFADAKGGTDPISRAWNWLDDKTKGWVLNLNQKMDVAATVSMYPMAEAWVRKHTDAKEGTAEFDALANEKYTDILRNTQAANTLTEKSDLARSPNGLNSMLTMYKSEAFANFNILYDAITKAKKYSADLKAGKNGVTQADVKQARGKVASAVTSVVIASSMMNAVIKLGINAILSNVNGYRDDEDEVNLASITNSILGDMADDATGMLTFGGELYDLIKAAVAGEKYYDPSPAALDELISLGKAAVNLVPKEGATAEDYAKAAEDMVMSACTMLGIPLESAKRQAMGAANTIKDIAAGRPMSFEASANRSNGTNYARLLEATIKGDEKKTGAVMAELTAKGVEEKDIQTGYRAKLKDAYKAGEVDRAQAERLLVEYGGKDANEAYWMAEEWEDADGEYSRYDALREALTSGDRSSATEAINELISHGVKDSSVAGEITELYKSGEASTILALQLRPSHLYTPSKPKGDKGDFDAYFDALLSGEDTSGEVKKLREMGYNTKNIMSALNGAFGNKVSRYAYMAQNNPGECRKLEELILDAYEVLGLDREEEREWIHTNWVMQDSNDD